MPDVSGVSSGVSKASGLLGGGLDINSLVPFVLNIVLFAVGGFVIFLLVRRLFYWAKVWIIEKGDGGSLEMKEDFIIQRKDKATGEKKLYTMRSKEPLIELQTNQRYRFKKKYGAILIRGVDNILRPAEIAWDYIDEETGESMPYITPIDMGMKDFIFQTMIAKTVKYKLTSIMEKLAPYATMALTGVVVMVLVYLHNKAVA